MRGLEGARRGWGVGKQRKRGRFAVDEKMREKTIFCANCKKEIGTISKKSPRPGGLFFCSRKCAAKGKTRFSVEGCEALRKQVAKQGTTGRIYLPPSWAGKWVTAVLEEKTRGGEKK